MFPLVKWNLSRLYKKINAHYLDARHKSTLLLQHYLEMDALPYLQPIVSATTEEIVGAEVLLRFRDKNGSLYTPEAVIEALEASEDINRITTGLMLYINNQFYPLIQRLPEGFFFTFNICMPQITSPQLKKAARSFSEKFNLVLEIVERSPAKIDKATQAAIAGIVGDGVRFAIDDFGSGYSRIKYLENMGITFLKLDRDLVAMDSHRLVYKKTLVALVGLARQLNLTLIAEGIEDKEQAQLLAETGIVLLQGYHFSRPLPVDQFITSYI